MKFEYNRPSGLEEMFENVDGQTDDGRRIHLAYY